MSLGLFLYMQNLEIRFFNAVYFERHNISFYYMIYVYHSLPFLILETFHHTELEINHSVFPLLQYLFLLIDLTVIA